jgi:hypothetical protein
VLSWALPPPLHQDTRTGKGTMETKTMDSPRSDDPRGEWLTSAPWEDAKDAPTGTAGDGKGFRLVPMDLANLEGAELPPIEYVDEPYIPARARVMAVGPTEAGKSMWAAWRACRLSQAKVRVVYFSMENTYAEDQRRFKRLGFDPDYLMVYNWERQIDRLDLADPYHVSSLFAYFEGAGAVFFDTLSECWSGDENDNAAIRNLNQEVFSPIVKLGASVVVLDHTGHQGLFARKGATAARGASSKGQKADVVLEFRIASRADEFTVSHVKSRFGRKVEPCQYRVEDTDNDGLELVQVQTDRAAKVGEMADRMVEAIYAAASGYLTTNALREAVEGNKDIQTAAMRWLEQEDPTRVRSGKERVETGKGKQTAKVWRPIDGALDLG